MGLGEDLFLKNKAVSAQYFFPDIKNIVENLCQIDPNVTIYLFGSVATNTATTYSDIDIAVITNSLEQKKNIRKKYYELKKSVSCSVDLVFLTFEQMDNDIENPIAQVIKNEGVEVYPLWSLKNG